jgi:signal transduction histidine kinase
VRLRRFAADLLEAKAIELAFVAPEDAAAVPLAPEVRRALYLTLKEAIHNLAKHSGARSARVAIALDGSEVRAEVVDDGRGIDPARAAQAFAEGRHGLGGMAARAAEAGGKARIEPAVPRGTRVALRFPVRRGGGGSHVHAISGRRDA